MRNLLEIQEDLSSRSKEEKQLCDVHWRKSFRDHGDASPSQIHVMGTALQLSLPKIPHMNCRKYQRCSAPIFSSYWLDYFMCNSLFTLQLCTTVYHVNAYSICTNLERNSSMIVTTAPNTWVCPHPGFWWIDAYGDVHNECRLHVFNGLLLATKNLRGGETMCSHEMFTFPDTNLFSK